MRGFSPSIERRRSDDPLADEALRFLDREVCREPSEGALGVAALIRGIDDVARLRAWRAIERRLGRGAGNGPRPVVIDLLDEREATLEEIGERPDRVAHGPREDCACCPPFDEWLAEQRELVEQAKADSERGAVPAASAADVVADAFATDGGEQA